MTTQAGPIAPAAARPSCAGSGPHLPPPLPSVALAPPPRAGGWRPSTTPVFRLEHGTTPAHLCAPLCVFQAGAWCARPQVRTTRGAIVDYFTMFLTKKPHGVITKSRVQVFGPDLAAHYGTYTFALTDPSDGVVDRVSARFSYTYRKEGGKWLITEHHSSAMPEVPPPVLPSEEDVRSQFALWNAALATLDAEAVADLYAPDATLLPTVSNKVRTAAGGAIQCSFRARVGTKHSFSAVPIAAQPRSHKGGKGWRAYGQGTGCRGGPTSQFVR
jgi:uncharacterized protein (TIGR02246 family)